MSKEQWGHGYHKGIEAGIKLRADTLQNWSKEEIKTIAEFLIAVMTYRKYVIDPFNCNLDQSVYPVSWFYCFETEYHIPRIVLDVIYDYIWKYQPFNTQITGPNGEKNIEEDEVRVYGHLPEGISGYDQWVQKSEAKMIPIFEKIDELYWQAALGKEAEAI